ncbi:MFS transporter [soil metagenome]
MTEAGAFRGRPTLALPLRHLLNISVYWLGINVIWSGLHNIILPGRVEGLVGIADSSLALGLITTLGVIVAIVVQPTVGAISDYTVSRWGRRKPYIVVGTVLDSLFLVAIATANTYVALIILLLLLQFSSNLAQGPFQGYVPDLVPAHQVGLASGLIGLMIVLGQMAGVGIAALGLAAIDESIDPTFHQAAFFWPTVALGLIELVTMIALVATVHEGRGAPDRRGRSWWRIARSTWGTDILAERSYVWLLASRLLYLAAPAILTGFALFYLRRSLGLSDGDAAATFLVIAGVMGITTALATFPAARLSDRFGRKPIIYASFLLAAVGMVVVAVAPTVPLMLLGLVPVGISAGTFLAVDWALMTDIIPKATAGRYMGISNVATGAAGPLGLLIGGGVITLLAYAGRVQEGPRVAFALTLLFLALAAFALRRVDEHRREDWECPVSAGSR